MKRIVAVFTLAFVCATISACSKKEDAPGAGDTKSKQSKAKSSDAKSGDAGGEQKSSQSADTVKIETQDQQKAGILLAMVETRTMPRYLSVAGQVTMDEQHTSHIGAVADGRVESVSVLPGAIVHRGQTLAHIHSHSVHETVGALVQAFAASDRQRGALTFATQARDRYNHLYSIQAASLEEAQHAEQMVQQSTQDLKNAQANVRMEREHLSELLSVSPESLTPNNLYDRELVPVRSPIEGVVTARQITVGQVVSLGMETFTVSNLASVWVTASVNEKDLSLIHNGAAVNVVSQSFAETVFPGRVSMVGSTVDEQTRTIPVRIDVPNPERKLRPGLFATAQITEPQSRNAVFVPEDALQDINGNQVVFVSADGTSFRSQVVKVGTRSLGRAEIVNGLKPGDHVVTRGAFMVKGELLKGTMGDG